MARLTRWIWLNFQKADKVLWLLVAAAGLGLAWLSLLRYWGYHAGMFDLGNIAQAVWSGGQGRPLEFTYLGNNVSRLSLHVELIYWLLAPFYKLWPSPEMLLILQAAWFALGAVPLYRLARRRVGSVGAARAIALVYLCYSVAQNAVLFDFHGDTLAMPLLLFAIEAFDRDVMRSAAIWVALALSCKFYVAVAVGGLGAVLWLVGKRRAGMITAAAAVVWGAFAYFGIRRWFAPPVEAGQGIAISEDYLSFYFSSLLQGLQATLFPRVVILLIVALPVLWLGRHAWKWWLGAAAIGLPALISNGPGPSYDYRYHHYALVVPFLMTAVVEGTQALRARQERMEPQIRERYRLFDWRVAVSITLFVTLLFYARFTDAPLNPDWNATGQYGISGRDRFKDAWLTANAPAGAPLAASTFLAPHLVNRTFLYLVNYLPTNTLDAQYALPDALFDVAVRIDKKLVGGVGYDLPAIKWLLRNSEYGITQGQDGLFLFQRHPLAGQVWLQQAEIISDTASTGEFFPAEFGDAVQLIGFNAEKSGGRRVRFTYEWQALPGVQKIPPLVAVSRLEGAANARIVHLPTLALIPTTQWQPGQRVREQFDVVFPSELAAGAYRLWVGWYDTSNFYAASTDARSRVGEEVQIGRLILP